VETDTVVEAVAKAIEGDRILFNLAEDAEGAAPASECRGINIGDPVRVLVEFKDRDSSRWIVSKEKADRLDLWNTVVSAFDEQRTIEGEIVALVEGGFSVDIGVRAFLPASQLELVPLRDPDRYVGQRFHFRIIKFHKNRSNIVLSRRVILEEARGRAWEKLQVGAAIDGIVKSFTDYGAFIDLGGIQGLLHVTDMSWGRVNHPSEILHLGDPVRLKVLKVDTKAQRVSLGLRQMQEDPWSDAAKKYAAGRVVSGRVVSITDYGVFVELEPGVEGLVHTTGAIAGEHARDLVRRASIGESLSAVVLETDPAKKRVSLRLSPPSGD
jgi:small subunit ribosomal protein S1